MKKHHSINYLEFPVKDIAKAKSFFSEVFGWSFIDYGDEYCGIANEAIDAGFYQADLSMSTAKGSALIVFYSEDLQASKEKVESNGGNITKPLFEFPGGRRFHFVDPCANEFAVWSDK